MKLLRSWIYTLIKIGLVGLVTWVLLEAVSRLIWGGHDCAKLLTRETCLLPAPLLTEDQLEALDNLASDKKTYYRFDPVLGWSIRPSVSTEHNGATYTSNAIGIRALRDYTPHPAKGVRRIAAFGPSFIHCDEVSDEATWTYFLENSQPGLEVMNWGVPGYGTDQALLGYETRGAAYAPGIVLIGYEEENIRRNVTRFRPFYAGNTDLPLTKPAFILESTGLKLLPNPFGSAAELRDTILHDPNGFLDRVCPYDLYCVRPRYQPLPLDGLKSFRLLRTLIFAVEYANKVSTFSSPLLDAYQDPYQQQLTLHLIYTFIEKVQQNGAVPVIVIFPRLGTVERYNQGEAPYYYAGVLRLRGEGIYILDLTEPLANAGRSQGIEVSSFFSPGGHYNEAGNRVVSQAILAYLCQQKILAGCSESGGLE
jgi:hypothetical protein